VNKFWKVIHLLDWNSHFDADITSDRLLNQTIMDIKDFRDGYDNLRHLVSQLVMYRYLNNSLIVNKGKENTYSNDYMFMDLPAHIIANGEKYCNNFINKNTPIDFVAKECFSYGINDYNEIDE